MMTKVTLYSDGACSGNPGPAGWAAILTTGNREKEVVGGTAESTNNRAEIMAVIVGLEALKFACEVVVVTDSQYVIGVLGGFDKPWKRKANHDLLAKADALMAKHTVSFEKVNGHSGDVFNERCDALAKAEVERQRSIAQSGAMTYQDCLDLERASGLARPGYGPVEVERQRSRADFTGTACANCGTLARHGFFCESCNARLTPDEKNAAWEAACNHSEVSP